MQRYTNTIGAEMAKILFLPTEWTRDACMVYSGAVFIYIGSISTEKSYGFLEIVISRRDPSNFKCIDFTGSRRLR